MSDTYRSILVHLADERRAKPLIAAAMRIGSIGEAHVTGLYVMPSALPSAAIGGATGRALAEAGIKTFRERGERLRAMFESAAKGLPVKIEWRVLEPGRKPMVEVVVANARASDLIITAQRDPEWEDTAICELPAELVLESGRPVLLLPNSWRETAFPRRVTIAWNDRREAARATFDAMPLLRMAEHVRLLWINPEAERIEKGDIPTVQIASALARHGVKVVSAVAHGSDIAIGDELLNQVSDDGSDLLIMGAYGHTRVRQLLFGGATRHLLRHMTVPLLLSH